MDVETLSLVAKSADGKDVLILGMTKDALRHFMQHGLLAISAPGRLKHGPRKISSVMLLSKENYQDLERKARGFSNIGD